MENTRFKQIMKDKGKTIAATIGAGSIGLVMFFIGYWSFGVIAGLVILFQDELRIFLVYGVGAVMIFIGPWSKPEKKRRMQGLALICVELLERNLVKKFLDREVIQDEE